MPQPAILACLLLSLLALSAKAAAPLERFDSVEPHMGTLVRVTVYAADAPRAQAGFRVAFNRIREIDARLSDYREDSELNTLTRRAVGTPVRVSDDLFDVLEASQALAEATDGAFDVTQGPVIRLWREARRTGRVPDPLALREASSRSGYRLLHLDRRLRTAMLDRPGMALDLGAIGKGYAASAAVAALRRHGLTSALVAISGDLAFGDAPPGRHGWRIDIHDGDPALAEVPRTLELANAAVSTAGAAQQHVDVDGRRYSHVIDPSTRMGLTVDRTVTVIAPRGLDADGLDTAIDLVGPERGLRLADSRPGIAALIVERGAERTRAFMSKGFASLPRRR